MTVLKHTVSEQSLFYLLLFAIALLLVAIYNDYSAELFNEFEYALAKSFGNLDRSIAGN